MTADPEYKFLRIVDGGETVSLLLNRPPLNILNIAMMKEINSALSELQKNPRAKVLLIKADGKAFSAGVDIADHTDDRVGEMMHEFHGIFEQLNGFRIPTIAVVDGAALGGGCELAMFCDMVFASDRAKFGQPEIKVGVFPPVAAAVIPRLTGRSRALELLMSGEPVSAQEAERIGLINRVFSADGFENNINEIVSRFTAQSRAILQFTKQAVDGGLRRPCMEALQQAENIYMNEMMKTEDAREGLKAFMEKRKPVWRNK